MSRVPAPEHAPLTGAVNSSGGGPRTLGDGAREDRHEGRHERAPGRPEGQPEIVYVLHFEPDHHHGRHYVGWARDVDARLAEHLCGAGSPLVRAALAAGVRVELVATIAGSRHLERRLKR